MHIERPEAGQARRRRPGVYARGTLGLAGVGAALLLALSATSAPPAFAVTDHHGVVLIKISQKTGLAGADRKLAAMGIHEDVTILMKPGKAKDTHPIRCQPSPRGAHLTPVKVLAGTDNMWRAPPSDNTGTPAGEPLHLVSCIVYKPGSHSGNTGKG
jgi:hypothetical protein